MREKGHLRYAIGQIAGCDGAREAGLVVGGAVCGREQREPESLALQSSSAARMSNVPLTAPILQ